MTSRDRLTARLRTVGMLGLLTATLPIDLAITGAAAAVGAVRPRPAVTPSVRRRTVLVSGGKMTKALALARAFHRAGHRVVLAETARYRWTGHRFSNCVDAFRIVPAPDDPGYVDALAAIVDEEGVDMYVPVCSPLSIPYDPIHRLDLTTLPLDGPEATAAHVRSLPISEDTPWVLQEFVEGEEYCTHGTVRNGILQVWACCRSSPSQLNYEMVDRPDIEKWVRTYAEALGLTGQVSFDFIVDDEGRTVAIECNPRTHSAITMFYNHPDLARGYLEDGTGVLVPLADSRPTFWWHMELWRMVRRPRCVAERLAVVLRGREALLDPHDPLPFLLVPHLEIASLLVGALVRATPWIKIDINIGKLVEPAGD